MTQDNEHVQLFSPDRHSRHERTPIRYPTANVAQLSDDARAMLSAINRVGFVKLDHDVFEPRASRLRSDPDFAITDRMRSSLEELDRHRLAHWRHGSLQPTAVPVSKHYTYARGAGSLLIQVSLLGPNGHRNRLLATLVGGEIESRSEHEQLTNYTLRTRHPNATDFEHDSSSTAVLDVLNPSTPTFFGSHMRFVGTLHKAALYPLGFDPLRALDRRGDHYGACRSDDCREPHPFAPYMPPIVRELKLPRLVLVETWPIVGLPVAEIPPYDDSIEPFIPERDDD